MPSFLQQGDMFIPLEISMYCNLYSLVCQGYVYFKLWLYI